MRTTYTESCQRSNRPPNSGDHTPHVDVPPKNIALWTGYCDAVAHRTTITEDVAIIGCVAIVSTARRIIAIIVPRPGSYGPSTSSPSLSLLSLGAGGFDVVVDRWPIADMRSLPFLWCSNGAWGSERGVWVCWWVVDDCGWMRQFALVYSECFLNLNWMF